MTSQRDRIIGNAAYLLVGNVGVRFVLALVTVFVARYLGAEEYAVLSIALAFSGVAAYFASLGLGQTLVREGTLPGADHAVVLGGYLRVRLALALGSSLLSVLAVWAVYPDPLIRQVVLTVTLPTIFGQALSSVGSGYFLLTQRMGFNALIHVAGGVVSAATLAVGMLLRWPLELIAIAYGLSSFAGAGLALALLARFVRLAWRSHPALWRGLWAFTLSGFTFMLLPQLGPLVLGRAADLVEVGLFAVAYRIPMLLYMIPGTIATAFYPQLFHLGARDRQAHFQLSVRELRYMSLAGAAMAVPLALHSRWVLVTVFGAEWAAATLALTLLAGLIIAHSVNIPLADHLTTSNLQPRRAAVQAAAVLAGVAGYWTLGSALGATGGALTALGLELFMLAGFIALTPRGVALLRSGLAPTLRSAGLATVLSLVLSLLLPASGWSLTVMLALWVAVVLALEPEVRGEAARRFRRIILRGPVLGK